MTSKISEGRRAAYYIGMVLTVLGLLLFASVLVTGAMNFGDFSSFDANAKSSMFRALGGMALMVIGQVIRGVGARGLAGSGVVLDPERARKDLEPYSRMVGGMAKDALDQADIDLGSRTPGGKPVVMIRCTSCQRLNEEDSVFCQECGKKL